MKRIGSDQLAVADPFEVAMRALEKQDKENFEAEFYSPDLDELVKKYCDRRGT